MTIIHGFELLREQNIAELNTTAFLYRHIKTGAELLSLTNEDENKVFGITFRTPPSDSTGVAHILEHSVLCGSRKYPVKEPFVELLKGSLKTFLNAFTYPDKTCYPVASQNVRDFYNLIDVYLDAVFYPRLTRFVLQQEGWHYELEAPDQPLTYKGVVYNEMKGAYSSAERTLAEYSQQSLFPDTTYGFESGGDPSHIPHLTFEEFEAFHRKYYHPSNAWIFFYGDDDPQQRLRIVDEYLKDFERVEIDSTIQLQPHFPDPKRVSRPFPAGRENSDTAKGMVTVNWLLTETTQAEINLALHVLDYALLGMPGSPLRKALIDSGLGEDIVGSGIEGELRQMFFSTGLKGIDIRDAQQVEELILSTLEKLAKEGIDPNAIEAAVNTIEFGLRENNSGQAPRGLGLMLRALTTWLYGGDPMALLAFEGLLDAVKKHISTDRYYFEKMIERFFLSNRHRTTLILEPDLELAEREAEAERVRLERARQAMTPEDLQAVIEAALELKRRQESPDPPEALAAIPTLRLQDLDPKNKVIPLTLMEQKETPILYHDLFTNGIAYMDLGLNLRALPQQYLPYAPLLGRAFVELGTEEEDYVSLSQRISRKTGGIHPRHFSSMVKNENDSSVWLFLRGKAMLGQAQDLLSIFRDVLLTVRLDNKERFRQMVLEEKARHEQRLVPSGHSVVDTRLRSHFNEADWASEQMSGISYLFFLRKLARMIDGQWPSVLSMLEQMRRILVNRRNMLLNVTVDTSGWSHLAPQVGEFLQALPASPVGLSRWTPEPLPEFEGMTMPIQVNYVGKGANIYPMGYRFDGSTLVITRYLRTSWLWEKVRVQGGAYGAFCHLNRVTGVLTFVSYRDPNLVKTLETFDKTAHFLSNVELNEDELRKSIIGAIGDLDAYMLPDAKGYTSMVRHLSGETDEDLQRMREQILATKIDRFREFSNFLGGVKDKGLITVLGSPDAVEAARGDGLPQLNLLKVL